MKTHRASVHEGSVSICRSTINEPPRALLALDEMQRVENEGGVGLDRLCLGSITSFTLGEKLFQSSQALVHGLGKPCLEHYL